MRPVASGIHGLLRPSLSISIVKLLLGRITKKHSIFLALILVPKNTPYALLVLVKYLIRAFIPFFP